MTSKDIRTSIDNSIRSLFRMIVVVNDRTGECMIFDSDTCIPCIEEEGYRPGTTALFSDVCACLLKDVHPADRESFRRLTDHDEYVRAITANVHLSVECRLRHAPRRYRWYEIIICNTTAADSTEGNDSLFMMRDIDERKRRELKREAEERAAFLDLQSRYDTLFEENMTDQQTGCYNRKGLKYHSDIVIDEARRSNRYLFVCVADLNGLKYLNDTYGHAAGDEAIAAVSSELKRSAPEGAKEVRTGGDEFLIFAALDKDSDEPEGFGRKVDDGLKKYNEAHPNPYTIGASYGWVLLPVKEDMTGLDEYIEMADAKMYEMRIERDKHRRN